MIHVELFLLKCAVIERGLRKTTAIYDERAALVEQKQLDEVISTQVKRFALTDRVNSQRMANYYRVFYLLENDIRGLISETLESAHGVDWWDKTVPQNVRDEAKRNREREAASGVSFRSEDEIDYITFGQLSDILSANFSDFAGILSNKAGVLRVLANLNMLRGAIAHCGLLADDEVDRLTLTIKDWFRLQSGPS